MELHGTIIKQTSYNWHVSSGVSFSINGAPPNYFKSMFVAYDNVSAMQKREKQHFIALIIWVRKAGVPAHCAVTLEDDRRIFLTSL